MNIVTLEGYLPEPGAYDELWLGAPEIRPHWQPYLDAAAQLDLMQVRSDIRRLLQENGVTYNVHGDPAGQPRDWQLDVVPLIIDESDWTAIEAGIRQRAELLNLILADLYGAQTLIKQGLIPPELVYLHDGYLRPCLNIEHKGPHLPIYAADLGRGPDGRMWVLGDRTQAPSGMGYAIENRTVMARVMSGMFADGRIRRLSNFFRQFRAALYELAPRGSDSPQVAVLTPGPYNETYFEHAYLASYLGFALVQGNDLTVSDGQLALKTMAGLRPVDVVLRRVDDRFCDPLELLNYSQLGVAGLVETARRRHVAIANPLGSGVLENPGFMPFLPGLTRHFLSEDLRLPTAATWWCGQPAELTYVLEHLPELVIKRIARSTRSSTVFGHKLSQRELDELGARIRQTPHLYVGQEQVGFSTVPSLVDGRFEARHTILRAFAVGARDGYSVMPGGLTRSAKHPHDFVVSGQAEGISRDTWVLTAEPESYASLWLQSERLHKTLEQSVLLPSRSAENLFWVGRYAERSEATARLLRTILDQLLQTRGAHDRVRLAALHQLLRALTQITLTYPGFIGAEEEDAALLAARFADPELELRTVMLDPASAGSLVSGLQALIRSAFAVRDLWSSDSWRVLDGIEATVTVMSHDAATRPFPLLLDDLNRLITQLMAFAGLNAESTTRGLSWIMLDSGRRMERAQSLIAFVRAMLVQVDEPAIEALNLENVLITTENVITYRRRYRSYLHIQTVLEQLLLDATNPRGLIYQLDHLQDHLRQLPRPYLGFRMSDEERLVLDAATRLRLSELQEVCRTDVDHQLRPGLDEMLAGVSGRLNDTSITLNNYYFTHAQAPQSLLGLGPVEA
jgi:uncharacterized circularly permuted ATP-grasp superfamily protein/uncharacterized alpha-E superfamily protein